MTFAAKKDLGVAFLIATIIVAAMGAGIFFMVMSGGAPAEIGGGVVLLVFALFYIWVLLGATYEITSSHVIIRCGPLRWRIRLDELVEAVPTASRRLLLGGTHGRFALSADALMIKYRKKNGMKWLGLFEPRVLISPKDKTGFLQALAEAQPNLERSDDGGLRHRPGVSG